MSEMKGCAEFAKYDTMPTEELQEILHKHAHGELLVQMDVEELYYIMEVLADRRYDTPEQAAKATEEAYATFRKYYMPKESTKKIDASRWIRVAAVIAIVFVTLFAASTTAEAFGVDVWGKVAYWTKEIFHFADGTQNTEVATPEKENNLELASLQDALAQQNISEKIVPTWLPKGYVHKDLLVTNSPKERLICAIFENNDVELIVRIRQTIGTQASQVEKNDDLWEVYVVNGVEYYIFSNTETLQAAWSIGEFECVIIGKITLEEMKRMIDSI